MAQIGMMAAALVAMGSAAQAAEPLVGPWPVDDPTQVLVLGTPHLSGLDPLKPEWLEPLLDKLAAWKPTVITIEGLSGPECDQLRRYAKSWPGTADDYCSRVESVSALAAKTTGLDRPAAEAAADAAVKGLGAASTPAQRRNAAALFAAAGNLGSAAVQWLRLPPAERRAGDNVDAPLAEALDALVIRRNENYLIAATLAARLGLERVYPTDDHLSDRLQADPPPGRDEAMRAIWSGERPPLAREAEAIEKRLNNGNDVLKLYRLMNRADFGDQSVRADMGRAFVQPSPGQHGRRYVAWWEVRNLHMVGNVRAAIGSDIGGRALVVVGSTHKPYFDAYLGMMHEVRVVPTNEIIGQ